jgi:hypothetical protein
MRSWLLPAALVLLLTGCADVGSDSPGPDAQSAADRCEPPPPDVYPFAITDALKPPAVRLQRPLIATDNGVVYLAADILGADGSVQAKGALWVAKDVNGTGLAALSDSAKAASNLPDGRETYKVSPDDKAAKKAQACSAGS